MCDGELVAEKWHSSTATVRYDCIIPVLLLGALLLDVLLLDVLLLG